MSSGPTGAGALHHIELWVPDLAGALPRWEWLLTGLGYRQHQRWEHGVSFLLGATYLVLEQSPALLPGPHERTRAGLNHLVACHSSSVSVGGGIMGDAEPGAGVIGH